MLHLMRCGVFGEIYAVALGPRFDRRRGPLCAPGARAMQWSIRCGVLLSARTVVFGPRTFVLFAGARASLRLAPPATPCHNAERCGVRLQAHAVAAGPRLKWSAGLSLYSLPGPAIMPGAVA